ncbi:hypothetical protein A3D03_06350 [Candidatus Gottesmanbacteria bacterium RIFCSPHIGHO2_02_FULL_40_13]|uniref:Glycosyltransferase RgtA/B/C/D-like domain-containing protein n=1 Tax=Candidatus Gottesmanbacteria bacterium RIFCSPHIGHO2_02_FULL_40_13 TaxID=1798384 RepID=A0A1F6A5I6_9BACT|nr:MAG: hypothetical protein A3D03_06350 [Candidatus Gottesmanbacteria bacterium RIFCSPHIGHO2_02_FULL_40_13]
MPKEAKFTGHLLIIILASFIIRLPLFFSNNAFTTPDSDGYYKLERKLSGGKILNLVFNDERTPFYLAFLHLGMILTGNHNPNYQSSEFYKGAYLITSLQTIFGILGISLIYLTLKKIRVNPQKALLFSLFLSLNIMIFSWEKILLTESLTIFLLILIFYIAVNLLIYNTKPYKLLLILCSMALFLLKPIYLGLPILFLIIYLSHNYQREKISFVIIFLIIYSTLPVSYIGYNFLERKYLGINHITDINMLGKIMQFNLSITNAQKFPYFYETLSDYRQKKLPQMPYRFLEYYDPEIYDHTEKLNTLAGFNSKVISSNLREFLTRSALQIPSAMLENSEIINTVIPPSGVTNLIYLNLFKLYSAIQYLTLISIPFLFISVFLFFRKRNNLKLAVIFLAGLISFYQIVLSVFFSYGEFGRLIVVVQPFLYLFTFYWCGQLWLFLKKTSKLAQ